MDSILKRLQRKDNKVSLHSKEDVDQLLFELKSAHLKIDHNLDCRIRLAIQKVKVQMYYDSLVKSLQKRKKTNEDALTGLKTNGIGNDNAKTRNIDSGNRGYVSFVGLDYGETLTRVCVQELRNKDAATICYLKSKRHPVIQSPKKGAKLLKKQIYQMVVEHLIKVLYDIFKMLGYDMILCVRDCPTALEWALKDAVDIALYLYIADIRPGTIDITNMLRGKRVVGNLFFVSQRSKLDFSLDLVKNTTKFIDGYDDEISTDYMESIQLSYFGLIHEKNKGRFANYNVSIIDKYVSKYSEPKSQKSSLNKKNSIKKTESATTEHARIVHGISKGSNKSEGNLYTEYEYGLSDW